MMKRIAKILNKVSIALFLVVWIGAVLLVLSGCSNRDSEASTIEITQQSQSTVSTEKDTGYESEKDETTEDNTEKIIEEMERLEAEILEYKNELSALEESAPEEFIIVDCPTCQGGTIKFVCEHCNGTGIEPSMQAYGMACFYCSSSFNDAGLGYQDCEDCGTYLVPSGKIQQENPNYASEYAAYASAVNELQEEIDERQSLIDAYVYELTGEVSEDEQVSNSTSVSSNAGYVPNTDTTLNKTKVTCILCNGAGKTKCEGCNGTGELAFESTTLTSNRCRACNGSGYMSCWKCNGLGYTYEYN